MKFILEKKVNSALLGFVLYLSFCISTFYFSRGELGYTILSMGGTYQSVLFANAVAAFFFGGLIPFLFYQILVSFSFRWVQRRLGENALSMKYSLNFFFIAANVLTGLLSLLYLISPIISIYGGVLIPFLSAAVFFVLYLRFVLKHYVEKQSYSQVILTLSGYFCMAYIFVCITSMGVI